MPTILTRLRDLFVPTQSEFYRSRAVTNPPPYSSTAYERSLVEAAPGDRKRAISLDWDAQQYSGGTGRYRGGLSERDRKEALLDVYRNNPWASACIDIIAKRLTSGGVTFEEVEAGKGSDANLAILQEFCGRINDHWDFAQFLRSVVADLLIFGEAYVEVIPQAGKPYQLYKVDCLSMTYNSDAKGRIVGYTQSLSNNQHIEFEPEQIIRWWLPSPESNLKPLAPAEKMKDALLAYANMVECQLNFFRRGAKHPYAVSIPGGEDEALRQIVYWRENFTGKKNINAPLFLYDGAEIKDFGKGIIDIDFQAGLDKQRDLILAGYGVPPALAGVIETGNIGGGSGEDQEKSFRYNTVDPIRAILFGPINWQLVKIGLGVQDWRISSRYADFRDDQKIATIQEVRIKSGTMTINEVRAEIGKQPVDGGDVAIFIAGRELVAVETLTTLADEHVASVQRSQHEHVASVQRSQQAMSAMQRRGQELPGQPSLTSGDNQEEPDKNAPSATKERYHDFFVKAADNGGNPLQNN